MQRSSRSYPTSVRQCLLYINLIQFNNLSQSQSSTHIFNRPECYLPASKVVNMERDTSRRSSRRFPCSEGCRRRVQRFIFRWTNQRAVRGCGCRSFSRLLWSVRFFDRATDPIFHTLKYISLRRWKITTYNYLTTLDLRTLVGFLVLFTARANVLLDLYINSAGYMSLIVISWEDLLRFEILFSVERLYGVSAYLRAQLKQNIQP